LSLNSTEVYCNSNNATAECIGFIESVEKTSSDLMWSHVLCLQRIVSYRRLAKWIGALDVSLVTPLSIIYFFWIRLA